MGFLSDTKVSLDDFSKYRSMLMGFAIFLIMGVHCGVIWQGGLGVEIFMLLSGLGIYFSLAKKPSYFEFLKKRVVRVVPCYLLCSVLYYLFVKSYDWKECFLGVSTYAYWSKGTNYFWFVPVILSYYLFSPLLVRFSSLTLLILSVVFFLWLNIFELPRSLNFTFCRVPSYLLGLILGRAVFEKKQVSISIGWGVLMLFLGYSIMVVYHIYSIGWFGFYLIPYLMAAFGAMIIMIFISKKSQLVLNIFSKLGVVSLELYLVHEAFFLEPLRPYGDAFNWTLVFLISVPLAYFVSLGLHKLQSKFI